MGKGEGSCGGERDGWVKVGNELDGGLQMRLSWLGSANKIEEL